MTCDYCRGVGACPRCWGRAAIDELTARLSAAEAARDRAREHHATSETWRAEALRGYERERARAEAAESSEAALREAIGRLVAAFDGGRWTRVTALKHAREALASPRTTPPEDAPADCLCGGTKTVTMRTLLGDRWVEDKIECPQCKKRPSPPSAEKDEEPSHGA